MGWPSGLRHHYLAELFSQVAVVVQTLLLMKHIIYYYSENFKLRHATKTTNKLQESVLLILQKKDHSFVNEWKRM